MITKTKTDNKDHKIHKLEFIVKMNIIYKYFKEEYLMEIDK